MLRGNLLAVVDIVEDADARYRIDGARGSLHRFPQATTVGPGVTSAEMGWVYRERLVRKRTPRRKMYDKILMSAPLGVCPLCSQRTVSTLDHYLPVSSYAAVALSPANLVPACLDCNKEKHDRVPSDAQDATLHPYFDDYSAETWLYATVNESSPASLTFFVSVPAAWDGAARARLTNHFTVFKIASLYASQSGVELVNIRQSLSMLHDVGGSSGVSYHLGREADSRRASQKNSWQTAMYTSLAQSQWFCDGGFA